MLVLLCGTTYQLISNFATDQPKTATNFSHASALVHGNVIWAMDDVSNERAFSRNRQSRSYFAQ